MVNTNPLGNAWHLPTLAAPRGKSGMRVPDGPVMPGTFLTIINGNQFQGQGNTGNQFQDGSAVFVRLAGDPAYAEVPMSFLAQQDNDKFFQATWQVPETAAVGAGVEYYLRIRYGDHPDTFLMTAPGDTSATTGDEAAAQSAPFTVTLDSPADFGRWGPVFPMPNVAIHTTVLPNGLLLIWGRRDAPNGQLDFVDSTPYVWDPSGPVGSEVGPTAPPTVDGQKINLFCAGHAFLEDGRLLVVGGHIEDSVGTDTAFCYAYDPAGGVGTWTPTARMEKGRWYPTATTLPDGSVLVISGSYKKGENPDGSPQTETNKWPAVWKDGGWIDVNPMPNGQSPELYPRMHLRGEDGSVFMSGPLARSWSLTLPGGGSWSPGDLRDGARRDYAPSVEFAPDRIVYIGGGTDPNNYTPTKDVEVTDLRAAVPWWRDGSSLSTARRQPNDAIDTHRSGQIYSPPYLFKRPRPLITSAPASVGYRETFDVAVDTPNEITRVTWVRPSSVTHSLNMTQRIVELGFSVQAGILKVVAPDSPQHAVPGHYLLFVLNAPGVPSVAKIVHIAAPAPAVIAGPTAAPEWLRVPMATPGAPVTKDTREPLAPDSLRVVVGVTGTCPYGIGACWGGADEALRRLDGVRGVDPYPDTSTSTAAVHLEDGRLPALARWPAQFAASANGSYILRGVEVTLRGEVRAEDGGLVLHSGGPRPPVRLTRLGSADKVQWNFGAGLPEAATDAEITAFGQLAGGMTATVVGPLVATPIGYELRVRRVDGPESP